MCLHQGSTATPHTPATPSNTPAAHKQPTNSIYACQAHTIYVRMLLCGGVCVCERVSGGETQPSVGVDLERWTGVVMACPQGPSSCFPGHGCLHRGPRSPNMAVAGLLVAVSGLHKHTVIMSWSTRKQTRLTALSCLRPRGIISSSTLDANNSHTSVSRHGKLICA